MNVGKIIKEIRKKHGLTQVELARKLKVAPTAVSAWERNENRPLMDKLTIISEMFDIPITTFFDQDEILSSPNEMIMIPVVGKVSCGNGMMAFEEIESYESTPKAWIGSGEHFYLKAKGDSMIGARILEGDMLLIRKQETVENGEIAAVLIDDMAVLKRIYFNGDQMILQSENPAYAPLFVPPASARIIGKLKKVVFNV